MSGTTVPMVRGKVENKRRKKGLAFERHHIPFKRSERPQNQIKPRV